MTLPMYVQDKLHRLRRRGLGSFTGLGDRPLGPFGKPRCRLQSAAQQRHSKTYQLGELASVPTIVLYRPPVSQHLLSRNTGSATCEDCEQINRHLRHPCPSFTNHPDRPVTPGLNNHEV